MILFVKNYISDHTKMMAYRNITVVTMANTNVPQATAYFIWERHTFCVYVITMTLSSLL